MLQSCQNNTDCIWPSSMIWKDIFSKFFNDILRHTDAISFGCYICISLFIIILVFRTCAPRLELVVNRVAFLTVKNCFSHGTRQKSVINGQKRFKLPKLKNPPHHQDMLISSFEWTICQPEYFGEVWVKNFSIALCRFKKLIYR